MNAGHGFMAEPKAHMEPLVTLKVYFSGEEHVKFDCDPKTYADVLHALNIKFGECIGERYFYNASGQALDDAQIDEMLAKRAKQTLVVRHRWTKDDQSPPDKYNELRLYEDGLFESEVAAKEPCNCGKEFSTRKECGLAYAFLIVPILLAGCVVAAVIVLDAGECEKLKIPTQLGAGLVASLALFFFLLDTCTRRQDGANDTSPENWASRLLLICCLTIIASFVVLLIGIVQLSKRGGCSSDAPELFFLLLGTDICLAVALFLATRRMFQSCSQQCGVGPLDFYTD